MEDLTFKSEKVIKGAALFCSFLESLGLTHTYAAPYGGATKIKVWLDESVIDHNKSPTGNQVPDTFDSPEADGCFVDNIVNMGIL